MRQDRPSLPPPLERNVKLEIQPYPASSATLANMKRKSRCAGSPRDDERRIHPDLVPYDLLSEQSREYDRVAARTVLAILERASFAVVR